MALIKSWCDKENVYSTDLRDSNTERPAQGNAFMFVKKEKIKKTTVIV